ncbi:MAG: hydrogen gas-evolving membrane-bound hydrogenase subunit E [Microthrixaceae bacterium]
MALASLVAVGAARLGSRVFLLGAVAPGVAFVWAWSTFASLGAGQAHSESWTWVPQLGLELAFRFDGLTFVMWALIAGIGVLVFVYAASYMSPGPGLGRFAATMLLFAVAMLGVVSADNVLVLFLFWELTSVTSYLLIGTNDVKAAARSGALQALLITGAGGLAMFGGFVLLGQAAGTYSLSALLADPPRGTSVDVAIVLVLVGALTKSAQVPFHSWLPRAMNAPTPVSAYLHSATMVNAGVYLVARLSPAFAEVAPWRPIVIGCGAATLLVGGYRALRQHDLKLVLAYSTISQLGLMMVLFGVGTEATTFAGVTLLVAHGVFKAALFMVVGVIDHQTHTRDLRVLGGVARAWPTVTVVAALAAVSMAGLPPTLGFVAKEEALASLADLDAAWALPVLMVAVFGSMLTVAYSARFVWGACGPRLVSTVRDQDYREPSDAVPSAWFVAPAAVLAAGSLLFGVAPRVVGGAIERAVGSMWPPSGHHLALWHGVTAALGLSAIVIAGGAMLFGQRRRIERWQGDVPALPSAQGGYERSLKGVLHGADVVTGVVQNGSLPVYLGVILSTFALAAGVPLLAGIDVPPLRLAASPLQLLVGVLVVAAACAAALARRRFAAVVLVGVVGYGMAGLYLIQGAPDLAITQLLIETLGIVVFVLVVRHLPARFDPVRLRGSQLPRVAVAVVSAIVVFAVTLAVAGRSERTVADGYLARSYPEGGGNNVVNVIIVDFRAFDTLGEITVLVVAALGVASLIGARRRSVASGSDEDATSASNEPSGEVAP